MPIYHRLGEMPKKRHQVMSAPDGSMYFEQLIGNKGFVGPSSLLYHRNYPTHIESIKDLGSCALEEAGQAELRHRHFRTGEMKTGGSVVLDRQPLLFNEDCAIYHAQPDKVDDFFYRNGQADELVYVASGSGTLKTQLGNLDYRAGDYVAIPRGILHCWEWDEEPPRLLIIESRGYVRTPSHYRNEFGQMLEGAPYNERDIRRPGSLQSFDEKGEFRVITRKADRLTEMLMPHHPFDVVGWDGYYYPWIFSIHDFEPKVAAYHLPPPVHQTFECEGYVICSFCPRPFDYGKDAVPAPYFHSNVWTDEVLFYASDEFMIRKGIGFGSVTLHPDGFPHGPQPGRMEDSVGVKWADELAVMIDTFKPLKVARPAIEVEDQDYWKTWQP